MTTIPVSYEDFLTSYLITNSPCLLSAKLVTHWSCFRNWTLGGQVNWGYISDTYAKQAVLVADCSSRLHSDQTRVTLPLSEAVDQIILAPSRGEVPYIKDWHLVRESVDLALEVDRLPYETPQIFLDDWLNNGPPDQDDYRFCYAGAAGSFTPLHRDVYSSYSWSTNISGTKLWTLLPPDTAPLLRRDPKNRRSEQIYDVRDVDHTVFPKWKEAELRAVIIEQNTGETLFVPSGWFHQVENLTECVSLNHNWCNSVIIDSMYQAMKEATTDVSDAISDVKDILRAAVPQEHAAVNWRVEWLREVDKLLRMDAGWGWVDFFSMIAYNIDPLTLAAPEDCRPSTPFVHERVLGIVDDFMGRDEYALLPEVRAAVDRVRVLLVRY